MWRKAWRWAQRWAKGSCKIRIYEPFQFEHKIQEVPVQGESLGEIAKWHKFERAFPVYLNGLPLNDWARYRPKRGDFISIHPVVGVKTFSSAWVEKLNAREGGGAFVKAVEVVESTSPSTIHRFVDWDEDLVFDGNTFERLPMEWSGLELGKTMSLPSVTVSLSNFRNVVVDWVETIDIRENDVNLLILHKDLLGDTSNKDLVTLQIQSIQANEEMATFTLGLTLAMADELPRGVITKSEFPGIPDDTQRILT